MVHIPDRTEENLNLVAINRLPRTYTVYTVGQGADISTGDFVGAPLMILKPGDNVKKFRWLDHYFGIGGRAIWEGSDLDDYVCSYLNAPATTSGTNQSGDFIKVEVAPGSGMHIFVPSPSGPGTGDWDLDLEAQLNDTYRVSKSTLVPASGSGYFDYDFDSDTISVNTSGTGEYNLYDFKVRMFRFCHACFGKKTDGSETILEATDVIAKRFLNTWELEFELITSKLPASNCKVGIQATIGVKRNV